MAPSWISASRCRSPNSPSCRRARSSSPRSRTTGASSTSRSTISRHRVHGRSARQPGPGQRPVNTSRDGVMVCAQMIFKSLTDPYSPANEGSFRPIRLLTREGSVFHAKEPAPIGFYYEIEHPGVRPDLALPRAAHARTPRRRPFRLDLRHLHRRHPSRHRPPIYDHRAATRRLGRELRPRRQQRDVLRLPRRDLQLPRRDHRGAQRAHRRSYGAQHGAGRRGQIRGRPRHRDGLSHARRQRLPHGRLHALEDPGLVARRRPRRLAELCAGDRPRRLRPALLVRLGTCDPHRRRDPHGHRRRRRHRRPEGARPRRGGRRHQERPHHAGAREAGLCL